MVSSKPIPTESSTPLEKLEYEHAKLYAAYQQRLEEIKELQDLLINHQNIFAIIEHSLRGALK